MLAPLPDLRDQWALDPDVAFLNHGSFGAAPRVVLAEQARLRDELERGPVDFLIRTFEHRLDAARAAVAAFLHADVDGLVFVPNASTGVATALASLDLRAGDEVVVNDHTYNGVRSALDALAGRCGVRVTVVPLPLPADPADDPAETILAAVTERTRVVVVDAITSATALVLPVERIVAGCWALGVRCVVDAAHAPGQLPVDLTALDPDYWTGNLHKWAFAPKGTAVFYVRAGLRDEVHPLVLSHGAGQGFAAEFGWSGTHDPTNWFAAPAGIRFLADLGPDRLRAANHDLAWWGAQQVAGALGVAPPLAGNPDAHPAMTLVDPGPLTAGQAAAVHEALWREHRIEVPLTVWRDRFFVRLSAQAYNRPEDYLRLAAALPGVLRAHSQL